MGKEIERKFLVKDQSYKSASVGHREIRQAYLSRRPECTVRVRQADRKAWLTVKGPNHGAVRQEWEYEIPLSEAQEMAALAGGWTIEKTRWLVPGVNGLTWEIDEFHGRHQGLVVAEIELPDPEACFDRPDWLSSEVTGDPRYYNSQLAETKPTKLNDKRHD